MTDEHAQHKHELRPTGAPRGLREKLLAATRPEFRGDEIIFPVDDPVFGSSAPCSVPGCPRGAHSRGLCTAHHTRWIYIGRPDLEQFTADALPIGQKEPGDTCAVAGCSFATCLNGLCRSHVYTWQQLGRPELPAALPLFKPVATLRPPAECAVEECVRWAQTTGLLCRHHAGQWRHQGRPPLEEFTRAQAGPVPLPPSERIILTPLLPQLRREVQYALQCRRDECAGKAPAIVVGGSIRMLIDSGVTSVLDRSEEHWRAICADSKGTALRAARLILFFHRRVEALLHGTGWDIEYPRDVWRLSNLGLSTTNATLRFDRIPQTWLRELAKRWSRWRISTGTSKSSCSLGARTLTHFAAFLHAHEPAVDRLAAVDRAVLERYLAHLHVSLDSTHYQVSYIGALNAFFTAIRQHGWDTSLPTGTMFFTSDYPRRPDLLPRALAEHVMAQLEDPANLKRWEHPAHQLVTMVLMRCGLRVTDAVKLPFDCVVRDAEGAPYLKYFNHKMKREALVPIDEELERMISDQQHHVLTRWHQGALVLFPRVMRNADGSRPTDSGTYRAALRRWLAACDVRDERGRPAQLTPHQWRHTLATRLINRDVPQEVVRRILDHDSPVMTAHYARLHDKTIREHWEKARKVNISGQDVVLDPDGPVAEASWAKQRLSRATQSLPNGYCGLPVQQSCPHANACLTCPMFLTTAEFLPQHRRQRSEVLQIISAAQARGQQRLVEMNKTVLTNLDTIITSLDSGDAQQGQADAG